MWKLKDILGKHFENCLKYKRFHFVISGPLSLQDNTRTIFLYNIITGLYSLQKCFHICDTLFLNNWFTFFITDNTLI